jgi:catechol 2,3-dioxygenase-like lactoylglutathione lyase family enzyme
MSLPSSTKSFTLPRVHHVGTIVRDLDASIKYYSESFGLGPFNVSESSRTGALIRGKPGNYRLRQAFAEMGQTLLELSQVMEGRPIQQEFLEKNGEGVHHLGFVVEDLDAQVAELQKRGFKVIQRYDSPPGGLRFAFLDTNKVGGIAFEFVWLPEDMR